MSGACSSIEQVFVRPRPDGTQPAARGRPGAAPPRRFEPPSAAAPDAALPLPRSPQYRRPVPLPDGHRFRAATPEDLDAIVAVLAGVLDADFIRSEWTGVAFDPARDTWVVEDRAGVVVGYGLAGAEGPGVVESWGAIRPDRRGEGLGAALLDRIEQRAAELLAGTPGGCFRHVIDGDDGAAAALVRSRGLRRVRQFRQMRLDLDGPVEAGPSPAGLTIDAVDAARDLPVVHAVLQRAFAEHWGHHDEAFEAWAAEHAAGPGYDPGLWLLAREGDEPAAVLVAEVLDGQGWVADLGVLSPWRGRGLGAALLRRAFATFQARGLREVLLTVDAENATGATVLYERVGMRVVRRWDVWERAAGAV
jgi:mycothiol synthase